MNGKTFAQAAPVPSPNKSDDSTKTILLLLNSQFEECWWQILILYPHTYPMDRMIRHRNTQKESHLSGSKYHKISSFYLPATFLKGILLSAGWDRHHLNQQANFFLPLFETHFDVVKKKLHCWSKNFLVAVIFFISGKRWQRRRIRSSTATGIIFI